MLNLDRKINQSILIGEGEEMVKVIIKRVTPLHDGDYVVELGVAAPKYITVDREEVRERRLKHVRGAFNGNR